MSFDFVEYESHDSDGNVTSVINVYRVTEDRNNENVFTTGGVQAIHTGDVLVQSPNPNYVDVFPGDQFDGLGYVEPGAHTDTAVPVDAEASAADAAHPSPGTGV